MSALSELYSTAARYPTTSTAHKIQSFILSLYNPDEHPYSVGKAISGVNENVQELMLQAINTYAKRGETDELREIGSKVFSELYPYGKVNQ